MSYTRIEKRMQKSKHAGFILTIGRSMQGVLYSYSILLTNVKKKAFIGHVWFALRARVDC